jgi:hypothetical protein
MSTAGSKLKQIRDVAMKEAMDYEIKNGRSPDDSPSKKRKLGYDSESNSRKIEVKGQEWKWGKLKSSFLYVTETELREATHLNVICDVFGRPDLHIFEMSKIPFKAIRAEVHHRFHMAPARKFEIKEELSFSFSAMLKSSLTIASTLSANVKFSISQ